MIRLDVDGVLDIQKRLMEFGLDYRKELRVAITDTGKKVKTQASRALKQEIKAHSKILKKLVGVRKNPDENGRIAAVIYMKQGYPIPLKYFKPRKIAKGISATLGPTLGKQVVVGGFIPKNAKYKQSVMQRMTKNRTPVKVVKGPAPGDAYERSGVGAVVEKVAREELPKQIERRINFVILKAQGKLKGQ